MNRILISTGEAISLKNVSNTIATVLSRHGFAPVVINQIYPNMIRKGDIAGIIYNYPADPVFASSYIGYYLMFQNRYGDKQIFYTTIEGRPARTELLYPMWRYIRFVANSEFTRKMLSESGLMVDAVVPHGIDFSMVEEAKRMSIQLRKRREMLAGDKVVFGYVGSNHPRKNVDALLQAVKYLNEQGEKDFIVNVISEKIETPPNVYKVSDMGKRSYLDVLAFIASCDFLVFPTMSEGFGLPVLEAMAVGKIALHCWFPPLSEFSSRETNITWDYDHTEYWRPTGPNRGGIEFILHKYPVESLVEAMREAISLYRENREEYEDRCARNIELARKYDAEKTYSYFVQRLKR